MSPAYPRLFVYVASEAPVAVVLRRGPSAWVRLSRWRTETDLIEHGQWIHGRVYERRCDLSADGALFVYFARKDDRRAPANSWIAVSRPPWFTALALWVVGGAWSFGGLFPATGALAIGGLSPPDQGQLPGRLTLTSATPYVERSAEWTDRTGLPSTPTPTRPRPRAHSATAVGTAVPTRSRSALGVPTSSRLRRGVRSRSALEGQGLPSRRGRSRDQSRGRCASAPQAGEREPHGERPCTTRRLARAGNRRVVEWVQHCCGAVLENRVFDHEPTWHWRDLQQHEALLEAIVWLNPTLGHTLRVLDRFPNVYHSGFERHCNQLKTCATTWDT